MFVSADDDDRLNLQLGIRVSSNVSPSSKIIIHSSSSSSECSSTSSSSLFATPPDHFATAATNTPIVGWPPVRRPHTVSNGAKLLPSIGKSSKTNKAVFVSSDLDLGSHGRVASPYVKVNMDGYPIGRKIDLASFHSYEKLAKKLEDMFFNSQPSSTSFLFMGSDREKNITKDTRQTASKLLMDSSEFVLTFEDKEGDWMLVGDVPWRMFCNSVKRLRIMRTSGARMPFII